MKESLSQRELGHGNIINHNLIPLKLIPKSPELNKIYKVTLSDLNHRDNTQSNTNHRINHPRLHTIDLEFQPNK